MRATETRLTARGAAPDNRLPSSSAAPVVAVRGVKAGPELIWQREASLDVTYDDDGVEQTFALVCVDQVAIGEAGAAVHVGQRVSVLPEKLALSESLTWCHPRI